jgi:hypothetical protein
MTLSMPIAKQLQEVRELVEEAGFLPMSNKAERLFDAASATAWATEARTLREAYESVGYLSRSKALRLIEIAATSVR